MGVTSQDDLFEDQKRDLLAFASTGPKLQRPLSCPPMSWRKDWGKSRSSIKWPTRNIEQLGDALNYLDDNAMSKGGDIITSAA
ncbi:putative phage tail tape measure protein [Escherichia coli]|nr:putative phage tail tape measure protein [Escherichia coli]